MRDDRAQIRPATPSDAASIVAVAASVWPDEPLDVTAIQHWIATTKRGTSVAVLDGDVVGFVDGFLTQTEHGQPRWEVDLLAVSSEAQGYGIGRRLVGTSVEAGIAAVGMTARGLIRSGNVASERVFAASGFKVGYRTLQLCVDDTLMLPVEAGSVHVVPVRTFRYEGVWLEAVTPNALATLRIGGSGVTGALIPVDDHHALAAAEEVGLQPGGEFRFWERALSG